MSYKISRVVMTSGVSVWNPTNQYRSWAEEEKLLSFPNPSLNPQIPAQGHADDLINEFGKRCSSRLPDVKDDNRVSAEYSGMAALKREKRLVDRPNVVLVHTDSINGGLAAVIVAKLLQRDFNAKVEPQSVSVDVNNRAALRHNLGNFMHVIACALQGYDTSTTCFMPLGGYKVMTSLGYLAGAYFGFPTLYTHEDNQVLHEIPAVPVGVQRAELQELAPLMKKVNNGADVDQLSPPERKNLERHSWLFESTEGMVSVNAFGLFLMQLPENLSLFQTKVLGSDQVFKALDNGGQRKFILQQLGSLAGKLAAGSLEQDLKHETDWSLHSDRGQHLYKGASNSDLPFRCIYSYSEEMLRVEWVWTDHDLYEQEVKRKWTENLDTPHDLTEKILDINK